MQSAEPPYEWRLTSKANQTQEEMNKEEASKYRGRSKSLASAKHWVNNQNSPGKLAVGQRPRAFSNQCKEYLFKVLVVGELGTGKTSFIKRYVHQFFSSHYRATIGVDFALKVINWSENCLVRVQLWDIAGQERFGQMTRVYYKEAAGAFVVFDVSRPQTFEAVIKWKQDLDAKVSCPDGTTIPCLLLANKCDEEKAGSLSEETFLNTFCEENGFIGWFYTSPKDNVNIEEASRALLKRIISKKKALDNSMSIGESGLYEGRSALTLTDKFNEGKSLRKNSNCC